MSVPAKLAAYALVLAAMVAGGAAIGAAAGPITVGGGATQVEHEVGHP